jgi:hypothetical protein
VPSNPRDQTSERAHQHHRAAGVVASTPHDFHPSTGGPRPITTSENSNDEAEVIAAEQEAHEIMTSLENVRDLRSSEDG